MLRTLSSAPPNQWGAWLQALGASVHPVDRQEENPSMCTISSLLGMMESAPGASDAAAAAASKEVAKIGGRTRARRRVAAPVERKPAEEDPRDLDELLRDIGEPSSSSRTKASSRANDKKKEQQER